MTACPPEETADNAYDYDVVVIGSGFGGSAAALRLTRKGYRVAVLEAGRRYTPQDLPRSSWDVRRYLWAPKLGLLGVQRLHLLRHALVLSGAGLGGGSLVYAGVLAEPRSAFYEIGPWRDLADWRAELVPHFATARRMLGAGRPPRDDTSQALLTRLIPNSVPEPVELGVHFAPQPDTPEPGRPGCTLCGACMTGCRVGAKNTLDRTYLHLAEEAGATLLTRSTVTCVRPLAKAGDTGYRVDWAPSGALPARRRTLTAREVVFAAGVLGTQSLLHRMRDEGHLPRLSPTLGRLTRTNAETVLTVTLPTDAQNLPRGPAISAQCHPGPDATLQLAHFGRGNDALSLLTAPLAPLGAGAGRRFLLATKYAARLMTGRGVRGWAARTYLVLHMGGEDDSLTLARAGHSRRLSSRLPRHTPPAPTVRPATGRLARRLAQLTGGTAHGSITDLLHRPVTAHPVGGCVIGPNPDTGVVDAYHRVYGHSGLHILDASVLPANPGANPALTVTALAERALTHWPAKGEPDTRPPPVGPVPDAVGDLECRG